ncbi:hypothetical protein BC936DRAFT_139847 [Jimgerdemannia flammicorona]|uniref:Serine-threonine/tyrosine-protein kinase catalytic domain-containing protein n=1 Tax=Jimgerdemannia flammicorona TaxID=994334 RepID=A0A433B956_9FUNG|nr:hypothetical protein BC936DRAFT_139847 [Jimgerdemannia flammicorona]
MPVPGTPTCYKEIFLDCWETNPLDRPTTADVLRRLRESEETLVASPWFNAVPEATTYFAAREAEYLEKTNRSNAGSVVTSSSAFTYESFTFEPASLSDDELGEMDSQEEEKRDEDNEEMGNEPQESSYERIVTMSDRSDDSQEEEESDEYDDDGTVTLGYEDDGETVALGNDHEKSQGSSERRDHSRSRPRQRLSTDYDDDEEESDEDDRERVILGDEGDKSQESSEDLGHDMVCKDTVETTVDADPTGGTADKTVIEDVSSTTEEMEIVEAGVAVAGDVGSVTSQEVVSVELDMDHMKAAKYSRVNKGKSIFWRIASSIKDAAVTAGHAIHILRPHCMYFVSNSYYARGVVSI